jgi:predicted RNA-binding Zn ribbon-like protein
MDATAEDVSLLLALLNSTPVVDGVRHDALADAAYARAWMTEHLGSARQDWKHLRATRDALQAVVRGQRKADELQRLLDGVVSEPTVSTDGISWDVRVPRARATAAEAILAWASLRTSASGRLKPCENSECALFFIDRSHANSGRWCSMAVCGNRMKARRHYERSRQIPSTDNERNPSR